MAFTQENAICSVISPLGPDVLLLRDMFGKESVNSLFSFELELLSEQKNVDFGKIIGQNLAVRMKLHDGSERFFNGIVAKFAQGPVDERFASYKAELVPWLWFLTRSRNCRIFQNKTVPEIIEQVFQGLGMPDYELDVTGRHPPREYCVQYRESDFDFISRLMEDEGIYYYHRHEEKAHTLVVVDGPSAHTDCARQPKAAYVTAQGEETRTGEISSWECQRELRPGKWAMTDYNFETPSVDLMAKTQSEIQVGGNERFEVYDFPGEYAQLGDGDEIVRRRMEEQETATYEIEGASICGAFSPGACFELTGHYRDDFNTKYLLLEVEHHVVQGVGYEDDGASYENTFTCIPHAVPYRPPRKTPRPMITGVQTATVTGPAGEEIHVDEYGRITVQFHWDREGKRDESSSCWIRVAQNWAGKSWGLVAHPRIGQEVVVEFLEGNPDRPLVTGRVYNGEQTPPYVLPDDKTQWGIKSRTVGGSPSNFNELRFEDKKGSEEFFMHAEKNMTVKVKSASSETVGGGISTTAGGGISRKAAGDISRHTDSNIKDQATSNIVTESGGSMNLTSGGSYSLKTNLGIQLQAINFAFAALETGAKAAAEALQKAAGAASGLPTAESEAAAEQAAGEAKAALTETVMGGAAALSSFVNAQAASEGAAKVEGAASEAAAASSSFASAVASGDAGAIAESAVALAAAAGEAYEEAKAMAEAIIAAIPSIGLWAMKDITGYALWNVSLTSKLKDISLAAQRGAVHVSGKKDVVLSSETKDVTIHAKKEKVVVKAEKELLIECGKAKITLKNDGTVKVNGKQIEVKGSGDIKLKGKSVSEN